MKIHSLKVVRVLCKDSLILIMHVILAVKTLNTKLLPVSTWAFCLAKLLLNPASI